jgi:hypothetical protein
MKSYLFLIIIFFCINKDEIKVDGLSKLYDRNKNLEFSITNNGNFKMHYWISIDIYDGQWKEMVNDIYQPKSKSETIRVIKAHEIIKVILPIKTIFFYEQQLKYEKYRLKIIYGESLNNLTKNYYSNTFKIK